MMVAIRQYILHFLKALHTGSWTLVVLTHDIRSNFSCFILSGFYSTADMSDDSKARTVRQVDVVFRVWVNGKTENAPSKMLNMHPLYVNSLSEMISLMHFS